jgi:UDP:flavonoid glycosyltransferase YjiC (YdhE family)
MICLLPNCCFLSETSRMLAIHRALRARGAAVCVATHGGTYEWVLRDAGVAYDLLGPGLDAERCAELVRSVPGIGPPGRSQWSDEELRTDAAAQAAYFRRRDVRAAVTGWTLSALLSTRLASIPLVTEHAGAWVPPMFERGLLPAPLGRVGMPLERVLPRSLRRRMFNAGAPRLTIHTSGFNRVAAALGVDGIPSFPALMLGDLVLVTDVPEMLGVPAADIDAWRPRDPARYRAGTRLRCTGPIYARLDLPVPARVERLLDGAEPLIYVAITSSAPDLVRAAVAALRPLGCRILVTGTVHELTDLEDDRVMVEGVLPSHLIMPGAALAVIAGGQGSVQTALAAGVPMLGLPLQPEQHLNLALAERAGAGRLLRPADAGTAALTQLARELLANPGYRAAAVRMQRVFATVDGPARAAEAIMEVAAAAPPGQEWPSMKLSTSTR